MEEYKKSRYKSRPEIVLGAKPQPEQRRLLRINSITSRSGRVHGAHWDAAAPAGEFPVAAAERLLFIVVAAVRGNGAD